MKDTCAIIFANDTPVKVFRKEFAVYEWLKEHKHKHPDTEYKVLHKVDFVK